MGHLVNPISFRLGINVFWDLSIGCLKFKNYKILLSKSYDLDFIFFWFFNLRFIQNLNHSYINYKGSFLFDYFYIFIFLYDFNEKKIFKEKNSFLLKKFFNRKNFFFLYIKKKKEREKEKKTKRYKKKIYIKEKK